MTVLNPVSLPRSGDTFGRNWLRLLQLDLTDKSSLSKISNRRCQSAMLPAFNEAGLLPPGDHELTIAELKNSILVTGPVVPRLEWDSEHRLKLVNNLEILVGHLWGVGITEIYINGSFVERKNRPRDIDGYFFCDLQDQVNGNLERRLNALDPLQSWGWSAKHRTNGKELKLRRSYGVELFPYQPGTMLTPKLDMSQGFRRTKHGSQIKGIVKLKPTGA